MAKTIEAKNAIQHPTLHRTAPTAKSYPAQMSIVPRGRNFDLDTLWSIQAIGLELKPHLPMPIVSHDGEKMDTRLIKSTEPFSNISTWLLRLAHI